MLDDWSDDDLIEEIESNGLNLTDWEIDFLGSIMEERASWNGVWSATPAQREKLVEIVLERCGIEA
jgi:hypothetical protein